MSPVEFKNSNVTCHIFTIDFLLLSCYYKGPMSHVEFKKCSCHPVEFVGPDPCYSKPLISKFLQNVHIFNISRKISCPKFTQGLLRNRCYLRFLKISILYFKKESPNFTQGLSQRATTFRKPAGNNTALSSSLTGAEGTSRRRAGDEQETSDSLC